MLDDELFQFVSVGSAEAVNFLPLLDEDESRHACDVILHGDFLAFINVDLKVRIMLLISCSFNESRDFHLEDDDPVGVSVGEFFELWGDHLAGAAPGGMEINQDKKVPGRFQSRVEIVLRKRKIERSGSNKRTQKA